MMSTRNFEGTDHAAVYAKLRPSPPNQLITRVIEYLQEKLPPTGVESKAQKWEVAVDIGCGSGQCTALLSPHFGRVYGFDVSAAQITEAIKANQQENVVYQTSPAETMPLTDGSVDLLTAVASMHWFELRPFFGEVDRLLRPNGVFAAFSYKPDMRPYFESKPDDQSLVLWAKEMYADPILSKHISGRIKTVQEEYKDIAFPFKDTIRETFEGSISINGQALVEYMHTLSFFQKCLSDDPQGAQLILDKLSALLRIVSGKDNLPDIKLKVHFDYFLVLNRK